MVLVPGEVAGSQRASPGEPGHAGLGRLASGDGPSPDPGLTCGKG